MARLIMGELDYTPGKYEKLMVGAWTLTSKLPALGEFNPDGSQREVYGEAGAYLGGATRLYSPEPKRGLDGFFTFGVTTPTSTNVAESLNAGFGLYRSVRLPPHGQNWRFGQRQRRQRSLHEYAACDGHSYLQLRNEL